MPGRFGFPDYPCSIVTIAAADGTNVVPVVASGQRVLLHSMATLGVTSVGGSVQILRGDGVTRYTGANAIDIPGPNITDWMLNWLLTDGLALKSNVIAPATAGWVFAYMVIP